MQTTTKNGNNNYRWWNWWLTTALALKQNGQDVTIYESAAEIKPVGAGIVMANNAMQVFDKLGVRKKIENAGCKFL